MSIRTATVTDVGLVLDYMEDYHKTSNLVDIKFDRPSAAKIVEYYIQAGSCYAGLSEDNGKLNGVLFGSLEPFFFNKNKSYATDLFFFARGGGVALWKEFKQWAFGSGAERLLMGVSSGDERACQLLEVLGMEKTGGMYVLRR
jgi:hypothetical protein